jgi:hypothetical protein
MPGMYPEDQIIQLFGQEILWPGMDPETHKFTNGDFNDPAIKPSYIPAQTLNLILDNLQNFIEGLGLTPNSTDPNQLLAALQNKYGTKEWLTETFLYPGKMVCQLPGEKTPAEAGWPGPWENWSLRPVIFGLAPTQPPQSFSGDFEQHGASVWFLNTNGSVATQGTKKYSYPQGYLYQERVICGNALQDEDWETGYQIQGGQYDSYYIWEPCCLGGTFPSFEDGGQTRPPFISGGVAPDVMRNVVGKANGYSFNIGGVNGPFTLVRVGDSAPLYGSGAAYTNDFDLSRVVKTGPQNAPVTASVRIWRRI